LLVGGHLISCDVIFHVGRSTNPAWNWGKRFCWAAVSLSLGERAYFLLFGGKKKKARTYITLAKAKMSHPGEIRGYFHAQWSWKKGRWYIEPPEEVDPKDGCPGVGFWVEDEGDPSQDPIYASLDSQKTIGACLLAVMRRLPQYKEAVFRSIDEMWDW